MQTSYDRYEIGSSGQYFKLDDDGNKTDELIVKNFDRVAEAFDEKVEEICALVWATEPPIMFLSMDARTKKRQNKRKAKKVKRLEKRLEENPLDGMVQEEIKTLVAEQVYQPNFREKVAKKKGYKDNRKKSEKPIHYDNLTEYILANYECVMAEGLEADDLLSVHQRNAMRECKDPTTIICSRDKDLRITPGMHFGWECGKQSQFGPELVSELGRLKPIYRGKTAKGESKLHEIKGTGLSFFCLQLIVGDNTDNIPGLPGGGWALARKVLMDSPDYETSLTTVRDLYIKKFGDDWEAELLEQARLLWMVAELDEDGKPVMFELPRFLYD
jgi:5'-3' exonuclease